MLSTCTFPAAQETLVIKPRAIPMALLLRAYTTTGDSEKCTNSQRRLRLPPPPSSPSSSHRVTAAAGTYTTAAASGVAGAGDITWASTTRAQPVFISVRDDACDGRSVFARYIVSGPAGTFRTINRTNSNGCGTYIDWNNLYINWGEGIWGVRLEVCVSGGSCGTGFYIDNPLDRH